MFLYRIGQMYEGVHPDSVLKSNEPFDNLAPHRNSFPRSEAVFATISMAAADRWRDWAMEKTGDDTLYEIEIPDNANVRAHFVEFYEEYHFSTASDNPNAAEFLFDYYEKSKKASKLAEITDDNLGDWEVLIPKNVAAAAKWTALT